jgi:hypothetical protein
LPPALSGSAALFWLWILPVGILLALNLQGYGLIGENMDAQQTATARLFGLAGVANLLCGFAFCAATRWLGVSPDSARARHAAWALPMSAIAVQAAYLCFAVSIENKIIPATVAAWIYPPTRFLFNQFAFAMLPLAHGVLRLACIRLGATTGKTIALSVALTIAAPILLYLLLLTIPDAGGGSQVPVVIVVTGVVVLSVAMFAGIIRALMLGLHKIEAWRSTGERIAIVVVAFALPVAGLLLNRSIDFPVDFQAWEVYALVAANTAILLFASFQHARRPLLSLGLLGATFPFSLYFFIVFLPYTPLSILAVIVFGLGFLVLTPTLLFVLHLHLLNQARRHPLLTHRPARVALTVLLCALLLPAFFTVRALADKAALHAALDYVFTPAIAPGDITYPASLTNLRRALASHRSYKNGIYYPLLSDFYGWLVFDHLVLPDDKLARLEQTFFGAAGPTENADPLRSRRTGFFGDSSVRATTRMPRSAPPSNAVDVSRLGVHTTPAGEQNTTVTFALTLTNTDAVGRFAAEYRKVLPLPAGIFVSGFRLHINGTAVPGRIFEKKTALWVYTMIRDSERRDPGLLFYRNPGELELRVFPVNAGSPAIVEVDFLVPGRFPAESIPVGKNDPTALLAHLGTLIRPQLTHDPSGSYAAGGLERLGLPAAEREPYLHVIVDRSLDRGFTGDLSATLRSLAERFPAARRARVTLAHYAVIDLDPALTPIGDLAKRPAPNLRDLLPLSGGLSLDLALAHAIRQHRDSDLDRAATSDHLPPRPIFVLLSRHAERRTLELERTSAWGDLLSSLELHELGSDGSWTTHVKPDPTSVPLLRLGDSLRPLAPNHAARFKANSGNRSLEYWSGASASWLPVPDITAQAGTTPWSRAVALQLRQLDHTRSPGDSAFSLKSLVQASRETGLLLPATSYIVVENAAQWRMLEESERRKLGQSAALAFRETPAPPALWLALAFALWLALRRFLCRHSRPSATSALPALPGRGAH